MNDIIYILTTCPDNVDVLKIIHWITQLVKVICIFTPIATIVLLTIDMIKYVTAGDVDAMKERFRTSKRRLIACAIVFLIPTLVSIVVSIVGKVDTTGYTGYVTCANLEDIEAIAVNNARNLVAEARATLDTKDLSKARAATAKITNKETKKELETEMNEIGKIIAESKKPPAPTPNPGNNNGGTLTTNYPDAVVENLASFIGSEAGWNKNGFLGQLMTGAVYLNNFHKNIGGEINLNSMCQLFSKRAGKYYMYTPTYCNYKFTSYPKKRGTIDAAGKKQLTVVAKLLLEKKFTIPNNMIFQASKSVVESNGKLWGTTHQGVSNYYSSFGYSKYDKSPSSVDIYGNKVSSNFDDYKPIAQKLYDQYVK